MFATFTAPSFGPVHSRPVRLHACAGKDHCHCKPEPCHPRRDAGTCPHGRPLACYRRHRPDDPRLGTAAVPGLLRLPRPRRVERRRRGTVAPHQAGHRTPPHPARRPPSASTGPLRDPAPRPPARTARPPSTRHAARSTSTPCSASTAPPATTPPRSSPPPPGITAADLEDAIRQAAENVAFRTKPHPDSPDGEGWLIAWGDQLDVRPVTDRGSAAVTGLAVASYLAKYATKGTEASGHVSARITPDTLDLYADPAGTHAERLIDACWNIGHAQGRMCGKATYGSLRRWAHMLGFGGHFLTKARRYSVTFTALRQARVTYRRHHDTGPDYAPIRRQDKC